MLLNDLVGHHELSRRRNLEIERSVLFELVVPDGKTGRVGRETDRRGSEWDKICLEE